MLKLSVVTPDGPIMSEECQSVSLPGKAGELQILPGHMAILCELGLGTVKIIKKMGEMFSMEIKEGFLVVDKDQVDILCEKLV